MGLWSNSAQPDVQTFKGNDIFRVAAVYIFMLSSELCFKIRVSVKNSLSVFYTVDGSLFVSQAIILVISGS